jgi:hypothetical protein
MRRKGFRRLLGGSPLRATEGTREAVSARSRLQLAAPVLCNMVAGQTQEQAKEENDWALWI